MYRIWLTIGVLSFLFVGCAENTSENENEAEANGLEAVQEQTTVDGNNQNQAEPGSVGQIQATPSAPSGKLNPAHGEPGHDCAIAVGAPLDGSGAQNQIPSSPTVNQPAAQPAVKPNLQVSKPANGLNPAHGQPGHDCAVEVGAPLPVK